MWRRYCPKLSDPPGRERSDCAWKSSTNCAHGASPSAEAYRAAGASTFITEIAPDPTTGYDFSAPQEMLAWRDRQQISTPARHPATSVTDLNAKEAT